MLSWFVAVCSFSALLYPHLPFLSVSVNWIPLTCVTQYISTFLFSAPCQIIKQHLLCRCPAISQALCCLPGSRLHFYSLEFCLLPCLRLPWILPLPHGPWTLFWTLDFAFRHSFGFGSSLSIVHDPCLFKGFSLSSALLFLHWEWKAFSPPKECPVVMGWWWCLEK